MSGKKNKKKRFLAPRRMRRDRGGRLASARATGWVQKYRGKNIIRGYARWFGVDLPGAAIELRALGASISAAREAEIKATIEGRAVAKKRRKQEESSWIDVPF